MVKLQRRSALAPLAADALPERRATGANVPSRRPLFRQEVIEFQQNNRQWGRVVPLQPLSTRLMVWCIAAAVLAVVAFLFFAQYARKETASGYLMPVAGTAKVFAPQPGTISAVYVDQGDSVEKGQPLLTVLTSQIAGGGEDVNATILNTLNQQKQALTAQIVVEVQRTDSERERLTAQTQALKAQLSRFDAELAIQNARIRLLEKTVAAGAELRGKGLVSEVDQRHREEMLLEQQQGLISLNQQLADRQNQLTEVRFNLEQLPFTRADKIQAMRNELSATEQRIAEVNGRSSYIVRAPIGGRISLMQASVGQPADPKRLELQIVPSDSPLQAELFIPVRAIGFVEVGQDVRILYDAFPYQRFGTYHGRIVKVSRTVVMNADITAPVTLNEPAYRATVALDQPDVVDHGKKIPLQPDMSLRADIVLEKRTLVDWILNPILSVRMPG